MGEWWLGGDCGVREGRASGTKRKNNKENVVTSSSLTSQSLASRCFITACTRESLSGNMIWLAEVGGCAARRRVSSYVGCLLCSLCVCV